jgi:coenzyme F420-dependent glucose-6-phosphate dehydrogenase
MTMNAQRKKGDDDGLISTAPKKEIVSKFDGEGKMGRPHIGQVTACWGKSEPEARKTAYEWWRTAALQGQVSQELSIPKQFEQACATVREEEVAKEIMCGPDPQRHIQEIQKFVDAGYGQVYVHQVGPDQEGFFQFYQKEILPKFR